MLINFRLENWMSFRDPVSFTTVASAERNHGDRLPKLAPYRMRVLPVAALYGGNASGKTNIFKALAFARNIIVKGTQPDSLTGVIPFRLDPEAKNKPTRFCFEILVDETVYELSFSLTAKEILEERIVRISRTTEAPLYERNKSSEYVFGKLPHERQEFLTFVSKGTRPNQLFLNNAISQNDPTFRPIYDWFKYGLKLIAPDWRFAPFEQFLDEKSTLYAKMNQMLSRLDTGISHLGSLELSYEKLPFSEEERNQLEGEVKEGIPLRIEGSGNERIVVSRENGSLSAKKLVSYHPAVDGSEVLFEMTQESDGSQRLIDLLPAFIGASERGAKSVFVIDELDRSLHALLTRHLVRSYLSGCGPESRSQLLFTTHDILLMDQDLLRRDEMWVTERDQDGVSSLVSFSEYKEIRYDKDIRKSYLHGRLGGTPKILLCDRIFNDVNSSGESL